MKSRLYSLNYSVNELWRVRLFSSRYVCLMKTTFYITAILAFLISCNSYQPIASSRSTNGTVADTVRIANDSLEYEIIVIEPGFYGWLATQPQRGFYSQSTLEMRNFFYVQEYNLRVNNPSRYGAQLYEWSIDYDRKVDYGYEVNYLLYNYFLFFEKIYNQKLQ